MIHTLRSRIHLGAWAVFVVLVVLSLQNLLSEDISVAKFPLYGDPDLSDQAKNQIWDASKMAVFLPVVILWFLDWRRPLWKAVVVSNGLLTFDLLASTALLAVNLSSQTSGREGSLIKDTLLVLAINLLLSLWYWIIDSPKLRRGTSREEEPWDFLFPQRMSSVSKYPDWIPDYLDCFLHCIHCLLHIWPSRYTSLLFRAKMLMMMQVAISVVNIVVLAGYALATL